MRISTFFEKKLGANLTSSRWSWGANSPTRHELFLRVWTDQLETVSGEERILVLWTQWDGASPGFSERKRHVNELKDGADGYGVLCTPKDGPIPGSRKIAKFNDQILLKLGGLIEEHDRVYARVIDRIPVEKIASQKTSHSTVVPDLKSILTKRDNATTKETLASARVGQGVFRAQVLQTWGSRCCVTGSTTLDAIRASHIKPWRDSTNEERLDPNNGLPLIATLDALFDAGLITFSFDGKLVASRRLNSTEKQLLGISDRQLMQKPNRHTAEYLAYHRKSIFVDA